MRKAIAKFLLQTLWGWKFDKVYPLEVKKSVIIVFHHTSNWDFPIGILLRPILHVYIQYVGKSSLFRFPMGNIMRALGGIPVDRSKASNFVHAVAALYEKTDSLKICITPEGTRDKVTKLKTGFYFIAQRARVPIVMCKFDWGTKTIGFSDPFYTTGDFEADLPQILSYYKGVKGKYPEKDFDISTIVNS